MLPIAITVLWGCGDSRSPSQSNFVPIQPDATSTPGPNPANTTPPANQTPTPVISDQVGLSSYTHFTGRFSISYPDNWQPFERPDGVVFIEPGDHAGYSVFFSDVGQSYSQKELNQYLVTFVAKNFAKKETGFSPLGQEQQGDSVVAQFASIDPNLGPAINEVRVSQQETIVFVRLISATEEQWDISYSRLQELIATFAPLETTPAVETPPTGEPPVWLLIGPANNEFGFFYPSDWEILQQDEISVTVTMPESDLIFQASSFAWPKAEDDPKAAEKAALKYIETLSAEYQGVQHLPPAEFQLDDLTGATIDFLYTTPAGVATAGSIITAASENKMYQLVFTSSAATYEAALQWFNPMYKSFKILPVEEMIQEP